MSPKDDIYSNGGADRWRTIYEREHDYAREVEAIIGCLDSDLLKSGILEIGCGPGNLAAEFASRGVLVTATDRSPSMLEIASAVASERCVHVDLRLAENLAGIDGRYGLIISQRMAPGIADLHTIIQESFVKLIPGGCALLSYWDPDSLPDWVEPLARAASIDIGVRNRRSVCRISDWQASEQAHLWRFLDISSDEDGNVKALCQETHILPKVRYEEVERIAEEWGFVEASKLPPETASTILLKKGV